jgi:hypothetical protein
VNLAFHHEEECFGEDLSAVSRCIQGENPNQSCVFKGNDRFAIDVS